MLPETATRVERHTDERVNERIRGETEKRIAAYRGTDKTPLIDRRLAELDREWDVERMLQTNFALLSLAGLFLSAKVDKRWLALALAVPAFMVQHALQGWCPPLAVLRRLGYRTSKEIGEERFALKALRGDFAGVTEPEEVAEAAKR